MAKKTTGKLAHEAANTTLRVIQKRLTIDERRQEKIKKLFDEAECGRLGVEGKKHLAELLSEQIPSKELLSYAATLTELAGENESGLMEINLSDSEGLAD